MKSTKRSFEFTAEKRNGRLIVSAAQLDECREGHAVEVRRTLKIVGGFDEDLVLRSIEFEKPVDSLNAGLNPPLGSLCSLIGAQAGLPFDMRLRQITAGRVGSPFGALLSQLSAIAMRARRLDRLYPRLQPFAAMGEGQGPGGVESDRRE